MKPICLSRQLDLEEAVEQPDGLGGLGVSWTKLGTLWAEVLPGAGRDRAGEEVVLSAVSYRVTVRGAPVGAASRPKAGQRFRAGLRVFAILAVTERDEGGHFLRCFVREETPA